MILENANFFEKMTACFGDLVEFEQKIQQLAEIAQIDLSRFEIDHLAVRMNSNETAEQWKAMLLQGANCLKESEINGRPICLFELHQNIKFCNHNVKIVELPFPKEKTYICEGWEHIEVVFPMLKNESIKEWSARTLDFFKLNSNENLNLKISQPEVKGEQLPNPTIKISVKNATLCKEVCLKLHPYGIKNVIYSEI